MGSSPYPARTQTFASGDQVPSATLNAIQDGVVGCSDAIDDIEDNQLPAKSEGKTATGNQSDSPAPDTDGEISVWFEKSTNGTNIVVLDHSLHADWRDRYIVLQLGSTTSAAYIPGGASDEQMHQIHVNGGAAIATGAVGGIQYLEGGSAVGGARPYFEWTPQIAGWTTEKIRIFARQSDGALCMRKDAHAADPDIYVYGRIVGSPPQNHY